MKCNCDFCSGRKRWEDNWCSRCAAVQLAPPKWWENEDVCDECEALLKAETEHEGARVAGAEIVEENKR